MAIFRLLVVGHFHALLCIIESIYNQYINYGQPLTWYYASERCMLIICALAALHRIDKRLSTKTKDKDRDKDKDKEKTN